MPRTTKTTKSSAASSEPVSEHKGQLTGVYRLPLYAQDMLSIVAKSGAVQTRDKQGLFSLPPAPATSAGYGALRLVWGTGAGATLAIWNPAPASLKLGWDGRVHIGGFIDRLHALEVGGLEIVVAEVVGGPLHPDHVALPSLADMRRGVFGGRPDEQDGSAYEETEDKRQAYPFIMLAENNMAALAQDALVSGLSVDIHGILAPQDGQWHEIVGLPLLPESITLLAP